MSIPVAIDELARAMADYGWAYLLTVRDSMRPHVVAVNPEWDRDVLVMPVGRGTAANAAARTDVTLCFPPPDRESYSLIVDGVASLTADDTLRFAPTGAILHRPAAPGAGGGPTGCGNDCLPVEG